MIVFPTTNAFLRQEDGRSSVSKGGSKETRSKD